MQRALATHPLQCFSTPQFSPKHHYFHSLPRNKQYPLTLSTSFSLSRELLKVSDSNKQQPQDVNSEIGDDEDELLQEKDFAVDDGVDLGWFPAFPHVLTASMSNFLFGYHIGVMNGPIVSIAKELGFEGNSFLEGLVVSIFIGGAFIGSIACGSVVDKLGCRRTIQIDTVPLILGAIVSAQAQSIEEMLLGRFLVGLGIGVNTVLVPVYISEVAPTKYRGSLGTLCQIGTCIGIIASLCLAVPSENDPHWQCTELCWKKFESTMLHCCKSS